MSQNESYYICGNCNRRVPSSNQTVHDVRCKKSKAVFREESQDSKEVTNVTPFWKCSRCSYHNENMRSSRCSICDFNENEISENEISENEISGRSESRDEADSEIDFTSIGNRNGWDCQLCTFRNSISSTVCSMCSETRPGDTVYRETLIGNDTSGEDLNRDNSSRNGESCRRSTPSRPPNDPFDNINRGILFGAAGGAGLAFLSGRSLTTGALSGAAYGALGGVLINSTNLMNRQNDNDQNDNTESFHSSFSNNNVRNIFDESSGSENANWNMNSRIFLNDLLNERGVLVNDIMSSSRQFSGRGIVEDSVNDVNMDYHQLISRFGNGHQQTPASENSIETIPTSRFTKPSTSNSSSDDRDKCFVCLDLFKNDEEISTLPCLHRFHSICVNRWLRQSNTCPICKNSISA